ncbi:MAG: glycoside hydrolase family 25 protein [Ruminococcus sp.]|nr:glycoside hydrolase family 25 protein [Ruminococcus sp.]
MQDRPRKLSKIKVLAAAEALLIFILIIALVFVCFIHRSSDEAVPTGASVSEDPQSRTRAVIEKEETFYQLDGKKILLHDGTFGEVFMPVFEDVPASTLSPENFVTRNGYSFYKENGKITSLTGVDISEHQGQIDWQQVKNAGISFAMIRAGYRTYGGGIITMDESFTENLEGAIAAGLDVGVYFFSQAINTDEAIEEADAVLDAIEGYDITYPVVYDWELIYDDSARTDEVSVETLADCCISFCERVKSAGYEPMIYQNKLTSMYKLDLPRLKDYGFWLAEYGTEPTYYYDFKMWQYSSTGTVPGISGQVDLNLYFPENSEE